MLVAFDARMWPHPGIGRYIRELAARLVAVASPEQALVFLAAEDPRPALGKAASRHGWRRTVSRIYSPGEQFEIPRLAAGATLLHVPHFNVPALWRGILVATLHDLIYVHDPDAARSALGRAYAKFLFGHVARKASAVITVSEATRNDFLTTFPKADPARVRTVHEAASPIFSAGGEAGASHKPYVLFVGSLRAHKNVAALIQAVKRVRGRGLAHKLVLVGRRDERERGLLALIESSREFVVETGEADDAALAKLYRGADAFVLPSFNEGFGLPVVEAMACGTPVLVSDRASLPEIAGEAGRLFDPLSVDALEGVLYDVLKNSDLRREMSEAGLRRAAAFSWEKAARETWETYRRAVENPL